MNNKNIEASSASEPAERSHQGTYEDLYQTMTQGVVFQNADGLVISANPAAERILGLSFAEMCDRTSHHRSWQTLREDGSELPGTEHPAMLALASGKPVTGTTMAVYNQQLGQHRWLEVDAVPQFRPGESSPWQVYTTFQDITERKISREALRQSEERFRLTFQTSPDAVNINRLEDGLYVDVNNGFCTLTGFSRDEVIGRTSAEINIWQNPGDRQRLVEGLRTHGVVDSMEALFRRKNGFIGQGRMSARVLQLHGVPHIISVTRDITEQTAAIQALRHNEELLESILRTAPTAIGVVQDRVFVLVNERICAMTGYERKELLGQSSRMLYLSDDDFAYVGREKYRQISEHGMGTVETRWRCKDGRIIEIFMSSAPLSGEDFSKGVTFTALDISEYKQSQADREKLQAQLIQAQKMESVGRLAGGIAHDFNNMLGVILGRSELLLATLPPTESLFLSIKEIEKAATRSADLTRQLLAFARQQTIKPRVIDLNSTIEGMLTLLRRLLGENINLHWKPDGSLPNINIDPSQLDQILANLCINARDAIAGHGHIVIETATAQVDRKFCDAHIGLTPGDYVLLTVSDDGEGIPESVIEKIFEPYFTTKDLGKGTGLGLATIYGIIKQNRGHITVESRLDHGSTFKIFLPQHQGEVVPDSSASQSTAPRKSGETILLVEDDLAILAMTEIMLHHLGYTVLTAPDPDTALQVAAGYDGIIHLVLTDVIMPKMNGQDLYQRLYSHRLASKVLYMSGYTADIIARHGVLESGIEFLQKPFTQDQLGEKIRSILD
jgi:two-component system, cell cycle sensor histidine kinase and response regulator CckA